jgi:predicted 3-demethylubiquinone-9 3-methyltransferase (glyoxalase superfamily)
MTVSESKRDRQGKNTMQKLTPFLWFKDNAEEAMRFYVSIFKNSKVLGLSRYENAGPGADESVVIANFQIEGMEFTAINGGPLYHLTPAISFVVNCETQEEVDWYWDKLSEGGEKSQCGWLTDKFGVTWQVVPVVLNRYLSDPDPVKSKRVMNVMLQMTKLEIAPLQRAYEGR